MKKYSVILLNALPDKKIKSLGNKCLIQINNTKNILDYHIGIIKKIFKSPEIIVVGGFESKKIKKYIDAKYSDIRYVEHNISDQSNVGLSVVSALDHVSHPNCLILNSNTILYTKAIDKIKTNKNKTFVLVSSKNGDIGYVSNKTRLINCYYGLPNSIFDLLYIDSAQFDVFLKLKAHSHISKLFLFEIINLCIEYGIPVETVSVGQKDIMVIDSIKNIERVQKKYV